MWLQNTAGRNTPVPDLGRPECQGRQGTCAECDGQKRTLATELLKPPRLFLRNGAHDQAVSLKALVCTCKAAAPAAAAAAAADIRSGKGGGGGGSAGMHCGNQQDRGEGKKDGRTFVLTNLKTRKSCLSKHYESCR